MCYSINLFLASVFFQQEKKQNHSGLSNISLIYYLTFPLGIFFPANDLDDFHLSSFWYFSIIWVSLFFPYPGTIGHVAHGKSTVVKAISGVQVNMNYMHLPDDFPIFIRRAFCFVYVKFPSVSNYSRFWKDTVLQRHEILGDNFEPVFWFFLKRLDHNSSEKLRQIEVCRTYFWELFGRDNTPLIN